MTDEPRLQSINGWVGLGVTSKDDLILYLYDENPALKWAIANVYEEEFGRLPPGLKAEVNTAIENDELDRDMEGAPSREKAESSGKLRPIEPPFKVYVHKKRIDWEATGDLSKGPVAPSTGQAPSQYVWEPLTESQIEKAKQLASEVTDLQWNLLNYSIRKTGGDPSTEDGNAIPENLVEALFRSSSYEFAKVWPSVRGSIEKPVNNLSSLLELEQAILEANPEDFFEVLANIHPLIQDPAFAKAILKSLGETGLKPDGEGRAEQALKAALYVELTVRHKVAAGMAKTFVDQVHDQIPF